MFIIWLIIGAVGGAAGVFFWMRANKSKAIELLNADLEAKIDELKKDASDEVKDVLDKLK
jgi:hypothetical protein